MDTNQPISPRRRLQILLAIPDNQRTEAQWDEIVELEITLAPGNREDGPGRDMRTAPVQQARKPNNKPAGGGGGGARSGGGGAPRSGGGNRGGPGGGGGGNVNGSVPDSGNTGAPKAHKQLRKPRNKPSKPKEEPSV